MHGIGLQDGLETRLPDRGQCARLAISLTAWSMLALSAGTAIAAGEGAEQMSSASGAHRTMQVANSPLQPAAPDYSDSSDHELTRLGARWDTLSAPEREALLREVKLRMAQRKDTDGMLVIRTQRRFGSVYSGNGRYLKIETKVIRVRPADGGGAATRGFGTGFEQRNGQPAKRSEPVEDQTERPPLDAALSPPVVRASDPSS
jgi:hypothetical protein